MALSFLFPHPANIWGFISSCRGSVACETLAPLQRPSLAAAFHPQPAVSARMQRRENQRPGLLQNLSWLPDAKRCYQLIKTQPASFLLDKRECSLPGKPPGCHLGQGLPLPTRHQTSHTHFHAAGSAAPRTLTGRPPAPCWAKLPLTVDPVRGVGDAHHSFSLPLTNTRASGPPCTNTVGSNRDPVGLGREKKGAGRAGEGGMGPIHGPCSHRGVYTLVRGRGTPCCERISWTGVARS